VPEITESTPRVSIMIAGETFNVPQPYTAGHVLTSNEASSLNQTYAENVRNNMASKVKALKEAGTFSADVFQGTVDDYTSEYEFGQRTGGGRSGDPVTTEAMAITRDLVRQAISKAAAADSTKPKLADVPAAKISELAKNQLAKTDDPRTIQILATARARVEAAKELTLDVDTGSVAEESPTPKAPKGGKAEQPPADEPVA
jgi:hypothetical protein